MNLFVTGGCGFIGSNFIRYIFEHFNPDLITNVDALTYAGNPANLAGIAEQYGPRYEFYKADITDAFKMHELLSCNNYHAVINFAAESHVDRSIDHPNNFIQTNVLGTACLLEAARKCKVKKFLQVSTDEVYGSLGPTGKFAENSEIKPSSPYSASKASADLLALSYHHTYGMDVVATRCSNNYGPYQFPEKLIPLMIVNALQNKPLPVYGDGLNVRDWIHVQDHCAAIYKALQHGQSGEVYNIGSDGEMQNIQVVKMVLDELGKSYDLIEYVPDRLGHDRRYAIDSTKAHTQLDWKPQYQHTQGIRDTVKWYVENKNWWLPLIKHSS